MKTLPSLILATAVFPVTVLAGSGAQAPGAVVAGWTQARQDQACASSSRADAPPATGGEAPVEARPLPASLEATAPSQDFRLANAGRKVFPTGPAEDDRLNTLIRWHREATQAR